MSTADRSIVRLTRLVAVGAAAVAAAAGGAVLALRGSVAPPPVSPTWGMFDDAEWHAVASQLPTFDPRTMHVATAMSKRFAIVTDDRCVAVVRGTHVSAPICRLKQPVVAFTMRDGRLLDVIGVAAKRVATLVIVEGGRREGAAPLPAGPFNAFGFGSPAAPTLEALGGNGRVIEKLYCASALRGVCGMSAQRRS